LQFGRRFALPAKKSGLIVFASLLCVFTCSWGETVKERVDSQTIKSKELREVLSKVGHLELSAPIGLELKQAPHLCWRFSGVEDAVVAKLSQTILDFKGHFRWFLISDFPKVCLVPQLSDGTNGVDYISSVSASIEADADALANWIDKTLEIGVSSKGVSDYAQEVGVDEDFFSPRVNNFFLVEQPESFAPGWVAHHQRDRMLHFGPTEEELTALISELDAHRLSTAARDSRLVNRIGQPESAARYTPTEVHLLASAVQILKPELKATAAQRAAEKLLKICQMAIAEHLGIFVDSQ
jgi:hypothetical protein